MSQQSGVQIDLPDLVNVLSFQSVKDYEDYISRLQQMPRLLDQTVIQMRKGMNDKLMPPRFLLEKVVEQCQLGRVAGAGEISFCPALFQFSQEHLRIRSEAPARSRPCRN